MNQTDLIISTALAEAFGEEGEDLNLQSETRQALVSIEKHGERLDKALVDCVPEFSRSYLQQLMESGLVSLNGEVVTKASHRVKAADQVTIELRPTPQSQAFKPEPMALQVVFEDAHLMVVNKPAGLVVHPAPGHWSGTLLNGLLAHHKDFLLVPRAGIVHRLDKDTSGLMVVARHRESMDKLVQDISARTVRRQYLALAHGAWSGKSTATVETPIGRDPRNRLRMAVVDLSQHAGKSAKTDFALLGQSGGHCLVRCILHTGRTHQIRVHMASIGHPLLADAVYGGAPDIGMERQAVHAERLAFDHPVTGLPLVFEADAPADMQAAIAQMGLRYNR